MVFSHVIRGRPGGLFQFSGGGAVRIILVQSQCHLSSLEVLFHKNRWKTAEVDRRTDPGSPDNSHYKCSAVVEMSDHNRHGLKHGDCALFGGGGELGPHLTQCRLDQGLHVYQMAS